MDTEPSVRLPAHQPGGARAAADLAAAAGADLDAQIHAAELAVIARDERVRRSVETVKERVVERLRRKGGLFLALAGAGAVWLTRRRGRSASAAALPAAGGSSLMRLFGLLLPLLPAAVRRVLPGGAPAQFISLAFAALAPLFLSRPTRAPEGSAGTGKPPVTSAAYIDLPRYLGAWYEIARLPMASEKQCAGDAVTVYARTERPERFSVVDSCRRRNGRSVALRGVARVVAGSGNSRFEVSFASRLWRWSPLAWHERWILLADDDYRYALVGTPDRRKLWLLSRAPQLGRAEQQRLIEHARGQGYDTAALISTPRLGDDDSR